MCKENAIINKDTHRVVKLKYRDGFIAAGLKKRTLVNCLLGINHKTEYDYEIDKLNKIIKDEQKPDIITDLSTKKYNKRDMIWYKVANNSQYVAGVLPIYLTKIYKGHVEESELLEIIIEQMENGVGLVTIHPTANKSIFDTARKRMIPITSRGGGIVVNDLTAKGFMEENVYLRILPQIISHALKNNVTISIGATFRSGNIFDCNDEAQRMEIELQINLAKKIAQQGVGVIIESPGHARPRDIIEISSILKKSGFPIMPLGPIPTDIAVGMDHISSAIGATIMGLEGCTHIIAAVTREEHTGGRPTIESTVEAIRTARIAAHIIDIHNLNDTDMDFSIAGARSRASTCILGKATKCCNRCENLCPLIIR